MLDHCKAVAKRGGLDEAQFDLKTFRSTHATRTLLAGFDVRTVQYWMGHKSLETTMRYLVPSKEVHARLDQMTIPGLGDTLADETPRVAPRRRGRPKREKEAGRNRERNTGKLKRRSRLKWSHCKPSRWSA